MTETARIIAGEADIKAGMDQLAARCAHMRMIVEQCGTPPLRRHDPGFEGLARIVISQQLSVASAEAIRAKVEARFGALMPTPILSASDDELRACGLSAPKIRTLRAIAEAVASGRLPLDALAAMSPESATATMIAVKGIGPWTADIYLMFYIGHPDVFASGDLALQEATKLAMGLAARPSAKALAEIAEGRWRPWRAVAARLLWHYYRHAKQREGVAG